MASYVHNANNHAYARNKHRHVIKEDLLKTLTESLNWFFRIHFIVCQCGVLHYFIIPCNDYNACIIELSVFVRVFISMIMSVIIINHYMNWLPFELLIQHHSLCAMNKLFKFQHIPLLYLVAYTHIRPELEYFFAQPVRCRFSLFKDIFDLEQHCGGMLFLRIR